jgi:hypothetical protein
MNTMRTVQAISIYDRSGMIQVSRLMKDFAPTPNGTHTSPQKRVPKKFDLDDFDFEYELERAMIEGNETKRPA